MGATAAETDPEQADSPAEGFAPLAQRMSGELIDNVGDEVERTFFHEQCSLRKHALSQHSQTCAPLPRGDARARRRARVVRNASRQVIGDRD